MGSRIAGIFWRTALLCCVLLLRPVLASAEIYAAHTRVELVSETTSIPREGAFWLGFQFKMDPGWHIYWRNAGDSGLPPSFAWSLPAGLEAGDVAWPYPHRLAVGPLVSYGYQGQVLLAVPVRVNDAGKLPATVPVRVKASWLACQVDCIPASGEFTLELPLAGEGERPAASSAAQLFGEVRKDWPVDRGGDGVLISAEDHFWKISIAAPGAAKGPVYFFPARDDLIEHAGEQAAVWKSDRLELTVPRSRLVKKVPSSIEGVLLNEAGWDAAGTVKAFEIKAPVIAGIVPAEGVAPSGMGWGLACLFAFLGGVILNFMPCVFPVLSIKVLQLVKREPDRRRALQHALAFSGGIIVSFWALALVLIVLKAGGQAVGWGFQFQSPWFVSAVAVLLLAFALELFGVFELGVVLPGAVPSGQGAGGAFLSGVFMTLLATPCTAPFMGSALSFALAQPISVGILVFTFLGLGLAAPMLLLMLFPPLTRFIPKPGPWMVTLRQLLGFVLLGCVVWLASVLGLQSGAGAIVRLLTGLLATALALWLVGQGRRMAGFAILVAVVWFALAGQSGNSGPLEVAWQKYDPAAVAQARREGRPVFINFTALWCLTCQVNDRVVFGSAAVRQAFAEERVAAFKADWTDQDAQITQALSSFGRSSVPLYVLYSAGNGQPTILPEILAPATVLEALKKNAVPPRD